jgi:hypothetical protein
VPRSRVRWSGTTTWQNGFSTAQDNVASHLADNVEARTLQGSHTLPSGYYGKVAHTVTRRASKCSSGTGKLSTSRAPTYASWGAKLFLSEPSLPRC